MRIKNSDSEQLDRMKAAEEFRLLLPSLEASEDRYIERGNKIPLLARILHVLLAVIEGQGKPLADDPDKYDSEIVSLVLSRRRAA